VRSFVEPNSLHDGASGQDEHNRIATVQSCLVSLLLPRA
jgi:hypothetical protein